MPALDALVISIICVAFVGFGLVLAWAEYQTRHLGAGAEKGDRNERRPERTTARQAMERATSAKSGGRARETQVN